LLVTQNSQIFTALLTESRIVFVQGYLKVKSYVLFFCKQNYRNAIYSNFASSYTKIPNMYMDYGGVKILNNKVAALLLHIKSQSAFDWCTLHKIQGLSTKISTIPKL